MIAGPDLERGIRQAMGREGVPSLSELARRSRIRRDTMYGWFRAPGIVSVSPASVDKLVAALGAQAGDPWFEEPTERTLDAETLALLDAAVERSMIRLEGRLVELLDQQLRRSASEGEQ